MEKISKKYQLLKKNLSEKDLKKLEKLQKEFKIIISKKIEIEFEIEKIWDKAENINHPYIRNKE